jgi:hypothetical protein
MMTDGVKTRVGTVRRLPVLRTGLIRAMLNFEIAEHPVYDGLELQWYDEATRGTGMLALLNRRDTRLVDCYPQRSLRLDPADYQIGRKWFDWRTMVRGTTRGPGSRWA